MRWLFHFEMAANLLWRGHGQPAIRADLAKARRRVLNDRDAGHVLRNLCEILTKFGRMKVVLMRCPNCWDRKVTVRQTHWLPQLLCAGLALVPVRCRHCWHAFYVSRVSYAKSERRAAAVQSSVGSRVTKLSLPRTAALEKRPDRVQRRRAA